MPWTKSTLRTMKKNIQGRNNSIQSYSQSRQMLVLQKHVQFCAERNRLLSRNLSPKVHDLSRLEGKFGILFVLRKSIDSKSC